MSFGVRRIFNPISQFLSFSASSVLQDQEEFSALYLNSSLHHKTFKDRRLNAENVFARGFNFKIY